MDPQSIDRIYWDAAQIASFEERQAYLDGACGGNTRIRHKVEKLLEVRSQAENYLESPPSPLVATIDDPIAERPGTVIGPYKLMEQIGEGGMGLVFVAEQQQPVRRKVALKVIKPGMDTRQVVARFEAERQALALMDHPNIAKVLDGGQTESGRPYFVMELVKGVPITDFCDQNQVQVRERLEPFLHVCHAVQHAHQKGIIHRDIKPSNVLIMSQDGTPLVKVIDFGVAKAVGQQLTDKTIYTQFTQLVGTPLYMSPEQAGQSGLDVDTRTDIYALGVLLYELLTSTTPFDKERLKDANYDEIRRIIREEEPAKPSTRISTMGRAATTASMNRKSDPRQLSRLFRGELDWIVMKALEKDRNRRYDTAHALAADVQRYLNDEPVQACPPSAWYRFRKLARRNRGRLTAAAVLGVALLVAVGAVTGSIGWAARDREARRARLTGQVELILHDVDRLEREQRWPEALAAAERAEAALEGGEADDAVRRRVGDVRRDLAFVARLDRIRQGRGTTVEGKYNDAGAERDYALAFREYGVDVEVMPPEEAIALLRAKPALAAPVAAALDDWVDARQSLGEHGPRMSLLVAVARGLDPDPLRDRLRAAWGREAAPESQADLRQLAESIDVRVQGPATLSALARALERAQLANAAPRIRRDGQYAYPGDFWLNFDLSNRFYDRKEFAEAVRYSSVAVSIRPDSAAAHNNLGRVLLGQKKLDEAIAEYRQAIALDPQFARSHNNLGVALRDQGKPDEAVAECQKAIELDPKFAMFHTNLGNALRDQGRVDEAVAEHRQAIELDPKYAPAHNGLGNALYDQKKLDEAIAEYCKAIELDPNDALAHSNFGVGLDHQGKVEEAVAEHRKAIALDPKNDKSHNNFGRALEHQGKRDEAIAEYSRAIALDPKNAAAHYNLGRVLNEQGNRDEAVACYRKAIELDPKLAPAHCNLGVALKEQGKLDEAIAEFRKALELDSRHAGAHCNLGNALKEKGEFRQALREFRRGHELGSQSPGWQYPSADWVRQCERLVELFEKLPGFLNGKIAPRTSTERIELAGLCALKHLNRAAARFYEEAFAADAKLVEDPTVPHCYNAACAAALAGCGQGKDADKLDDKERVHLRRQALDWLRADLTAWGRLLEKDTGKPPQALEAFRHWLADPDLRGVRGPNALAKMPEAERQKWQKLWDDVADKLKQAQGEAGPAKK
jgi:tetratricopeptide (TPR) repeat protein